MPPISLRSRWPGRYATYWFILVLLTWLAPVLGQAQDSTLTRLVRQNQWALVPQGAQFGGPGWEKLRAAVQQSQLVLLGEEHGLAQVPPFAAAVAQVLQPAVFAAEIDPYVAQALTRLAAQPGPPTAYLRQYPEALCFYDLAEEFDLVRTLRAQQTRLIGLDQVFATTAAPFYAQLASLVKNRAAKTYLQQRAAAYQAQDQAYAQLGHDDWVLLKQSQSSVDSLLLLTRHESAAAQQMAQDYAASYRIYKTGSHPARLQLMKQNLLRELPPGQPLPKMLFKFGAYHAARGLSPAPFGEFYDVGNFAQNLADAQGQKTLHLLIVGKQGAQAIGSSAYFPATNVHAYTAADKAKYQAFFQQTTGPAWSVTDLHPARHALTANKLQVSEVLRRILLGYDYLVVIPETTASRVL